MKHIKPMSPSKRILLSLSVGITMSGIPEALGRWNYIEEPYVGIYSALTIIIATILTYEDSYNWYDTDHENTDPTR